MKMKKWLKCLLMTMALIMVVNVGTVSTTIPAAAKAQTETVRKGTKFWSGKLRYKVISLKGKKGTVSLIDAKSSVTSVTVPKTVKKGKYTLTVTEIGANAFKNCRKLTELSTNTEIRKIGKNAFKGCKKLAEIDIRSTKLKKVASNALKDIPKNAVVTVPEGKDESYGSLLKVPVQTSEAEDAEEEDGPEADASEEDAQEEEYAPDVEYTPEADDSAESQDASTVTGPSLELDYGIEEAGTPAPAKVEATPAPETQKAAEPETQKAAEPETQKATETEAPKAVETEATPAPAEPTPAQTEAKVEATPAPETQKAAEPETQKATETEAPKAIETEAAPVQTEAKAEATPTPETQKATEPETQKATETEAPKAVETEVTPAQTEAKAEAAPTPETQKVTEPETQKATETEAPKAVETEVTPAQTEAKAEPAPTPEKPKEATAPKAGKPQTVPGVMEGPSFDEPAEPELKEEKPATCGAKHLGLVVVESTAPTCTEPGRSSYEYCTVCGYKTEPIEISALGHELVHHAEIPATCTAEGQTAYDTCARCGYATASQIIEPTGHSYGDWTVVKAATCTASGTEEKTCAACGAKETRTVAAKGHTLGEATIEPIPGSKCYGRLVRRCTSCDYAEKSNYSVHRTDVYVPLEDIPATCTQPGMTNRKHCPYCSYEPFTYVKPLGHEYSNERTYEEGTCVKAGISYRKCVHEGCNARIDVRETTKAGGHQWEDYEVAATCTQPGFEGLKCKLCGELDGEVKGALGHKYETTITEATCLTNGTKKDVCSVCHDTKVETLSAIGEHQWVEHPAEEATCVEDGHSEYTQCSVCGAYEGNVMPEIYEADGQHTWVPDVAACNFMSLYSNGDKKCDCEDGNWDQVFEKCADCLTERINTVLHGHKWHEDKSHATGFCEYVNKAKDDLSNMSFYILSASFLMEKTVMETEGWSVPEDSANVDVFDVTIGDTDYVCVDMRRRAEGLFIGSQGRANDVELSDDYTWAPVEKICDGKPVKEHQYVGNSTPFCMADRRVFMAVSKEECKGWSEMNITDSGDNSQTEPNTEGESTTDDEADLTETAPNMEAVASDAAETPQVIHGEMHVDLFGTTVPTVDDPGHEPHAVTDHEDPLVEPESAMAYETDLAG